MVWEKKFDGGAPLTNLIVIIFCEKYLSLDP